jgi:hypothetical protein
MTITTGGVTKVMEVLLDCLGDENIEVREMASTTLSGIVRCSQRQRILPLKVRGGMPSCSKGKKRDVDVMNRTDLLD